VKLPVRRTAVFALLVTAAILSPLPASTLHSVLPRGEAVALYTGEDLHTRSRLAAEDLASLLQRSLGLTVRRYSGPIDPASLEEAFCFIFGSSADAAVKSLVQRARLTGRTEDLGKEGALIKTEVVQGKTFVLLLGETEAGACHAVYSFLEQELGVGFFIDGDRVPVLDHLDLSGRDRRELPTVPIRGIFYHPTWKHPHANSWRLWSWPRWKAYIDWMRHKRFNYLPLFHDEGGYCWGDIIFRAFPELKRNQKTLANFVVDPAWRTELNQKIIQYARDSGIHIAYNLFYSQVPEFFADFHPELNYHRLLMQNLGISALQPECLEIMRRYWRAIFETHGIDDGHVYLVCAYQHEARLPEYYQSRNEATRQMFELLKELDPKAEIYIETWCWKYHNSRREDQPRHEWLAENVRREWKVFNAEMPAEIGVVEWDNKKDAEFIPDPAFAGRPYIQLTHTNMEGWWPPSTLRRHPQWVIDYLADAIDHGARGIMFFHIQADTNMMLADLAAELGWRRPSAKDFYDDYARRRFGARAGAVLAKSIEAFCEAVDMRTPAPEAKTRWTVADPSLSLIFPGFTGSAEAQLAELVAGGERPTAWIRQRLELLNSKSDQAARAVLLARAVAPSLQEDPLYQQYIWELDYLASRLRGITSLFQAHLLADSDPEEAREMFQGALAAFADVKSMFSSQPRYHMEKLRTVEPDVPYTSAFLQDWETYGPRYPAVKSFHVVWERLGEFEELIKGLDPVVP
jgi:hypothetical protein